MSSYLGIEPAYGRDYKSKKALLSDWDEGKDFLITDFMNPYCGKPINNESAKTMAPLTITARYGNQRKVCVFDVSP